MNFKTLTAAGALVLAAVGMSSALPVTYTFDNITNTIADNAAIGEAQLSMTVDEIDNDVSFTFNNVGPAASSITDIFFDDDVPLLTFKAFQYSGAGVSFVPGNPDANLPGGNNPAFAFSSDYSYDPESKGGVAKNGVNQGEWLKILFTGDLNKVQAALNDKSMQVGIHVQAFSINDGSESFINNPPTSVPEPSSVSMMLLGFSMLGGFAFFRRKK
jgi:hypothetical protein